MNQTINNQEENDTSTVAVETVLAEINDTAREYHSDKCFQQLFEAVVEQKADHTALIFKGEKMSYRVFNSKVNQLAHYLILKGVKPGMYVGVLYERSFEMIIGLYAVIKTGATFIPLDPVFPKDRVEYMLENSGGQWLLSHDAVVSDFSIKNAQIINTDQVRDAIDKQPEENPELPEGLTSKNLLYAIYTSGSTGKPKGIPISHRSLINFSESMLDASVVKEDDIMMGVTTISFDMAIIEVLTPLLFGSTLVVSLREESLDGRALLELIRRSKGTAMIATPVTWRLLLAAGWTEQDKLRVISGGEGLPAHLATELFHRSTELWNVYGPTETTVCSTIHQIKTLEEIPKVNRNIVLGKPVANTAIYVLSPNLEKMPINEEGEIHIGGDGLTPGYIGRDDLNEKMFIPNPFSDIPGDRLYKTGDLAVLLPDGNLEYRGRIDHQVKIRGFRIELGEIDSTLKEFESIKDCVVAVKEFGPDDKRLVGYFISEEGKEPNISKVRSFLEKKLPDYMVPSFFIKIDEIPLTPNKKIDRLALPMPTITRENLGEKFIAPETEIEKSLAKIWEAVFQVEAIGKEDNFFHLGGQSLLAATIISQVEERLSVRLSIKEIFNNPTVTQMASTIDSRSVEADGGNKTEWTLPKGIDRINNIPLRFSQRGYWDIFKMEKETYNSVDIYRITGDLKREVFEKAFNETAKINESIWASFSEDMPVQTINEPKDLDVEYVNLEALEEKERESQFNEIKEKLLFEVFDLAKCPLIRGMIIKMGVDDYLFLVSFPHIIADYNTINSFVRSLFSAYQAILTGQPLPFQKKQDLIVKSVYQEREPAFLNLIKEDEKYWEKKMEDAEVITFPIDYFYETKEPHGGPVLEKIILTEQWLEKLSRLNHENSGTFQMSIIAIIQTAISLLSKQSDITTGMMSMTHQDFNSMIDDDLLADRSALFPIRSKLKESDSFIDLLAQVRETQLEALEHTRCPGLVPLSCSNRSYLTLKGRMFAKGLEWYVRMKTRSWNKIAKPYSTAFSHAFKFMAANLNRVNKEKTKKRLDCYPLINVLPDFYEDFEVKESSDLTVKPIRNHVMTQSADHFDGNGPQTYHRILTMEITKNGKGEVEFYLYGGELKSFALKELSKAIQFVLTQVCDSPAITLAELKKTWQVGN